MDIISRNTIAAILLSSTALIGGAAMAQEQPAAGAGTSEGGANVIVPQTGSTGQTDTGVDANASATESEAGADAAATNKIENEPTAEGSAQTKTSDSNAETAGSADATAEEGSAKSERLEADSEPAATAQSPKEGEAAADTSSTEQSDQASSAKPSNETTASIDITTEQRTEIRNVIVESKAEPVDLDIDVNVGVVVPKTVELRPLPPRIIEIVPAYRSYEYFVLADGRIIIVEPGTLKVVYVITA